MSNSFAPRLFAFNGPRISQAQRNPSRGNANATRGKKKKEEVILPKTEMQSGASKEEKSHHENSWSRKTPPVGLDLRPGTQSLGRADPRMEPLNRPRIRCPLRSSAYISMLLYRVSSCIDEEKSVSRPSADGANCGC